MPRTDHNLELLEKIRRKDFIRRKGVEPIRLQRVTLYNKTIKDLYARYYELTVTYFFYIERLSITSLPPEPVAEAESELGQAIAGISASIVAELVAAESALKQKLFEDAARFTNDAMSFDAPRATSWCTLYLDCIQKGDSLVTLLESMRIERIVTPQEFNRKLAKLKRQLRDVSSNAARIDKWLRGLANESKAARVPVAAPDAKEMDGRTQAAEETSAAPDSEGAESAAASNGAASGKKTSKRPVVAEPIAEQPELAPAAATS
jgi:hypothetical protein